MQQILYLQGNKMLSISTKTINNKYVYNSCYIKQYMNINTECSISHLTKLCLVTIWLLLLTSSDLCHIL